MAVQDYHHCRSEVREKEDGSSGWIEEQEDRSSGSIEEEEEDRQIDTTNKKYRLPWPTASSPG